MTCRSARCDRKSAARVRFARSLRKDLSFCSVATVKSARRQDDSTVDRGNGLTRNQKTGFFHDAAQGDYVLLWKGEIVERFASVTAFVETHLALVASLEAEQDKLLESSYTPWLGSVSDDAH